MKKTLVLVIALVAVFGATILPAAAVPTAELTSLAALFPSDTAVLAALRTDVGYIETLDSVIARVNAAFPMPVIPMSLSEGLDQALERDLGGDFAATFGTWLGDTAVIGADLSYALDEDTTNDYLAGLAAIQITDRAAAEAFWSNLIITNDAMDSYTISEENGMTVYAPNTDGAQLDGIIPLAFADDYMLLGNLDIARGVEVSLSDNETFVSVMDALPNGDYNIAIYFDNAALSEVNMMNAQRSGMGDMANMDMLNTLGTLSGEVALGFVILDGRSLTIDAVSTSDLNAIAATLGMDTGMNIGMTAVDPAFAGYIPAGTPIVTHITDLNGLYQTLIAAVRASASAGAADTAAALQEIDSALNGIQFAVRGATGLELNDDILSWMTGDVAIWLGLTPAVAEAENMFAALADGLPINFGLLVDASANPEAAAALVGGLTNAFEFAASQTSANENSPTEIVLSVEMIGGVEVSVVTITDRSLPIPIELVYGANNDVFVFGTRGAAQAAFAPESTLLDDPDFQEAGAYILPDSTQVHYLAGGSLIPLANLLGAQGGSDAEMLGAALGLLSSSSISTAVDVNGYQIGRLVLTLPE